MAATVGLNNGNNFGLEAWGWVARRGALASSVVAGLTRATFFPTVPTIVGVFAHINACTTTGFLTTRTLACSVATGLPCSTSVITSSTMFGVGICFDTAVAALGFSTCARVGAFAAGAELSGLTGVVALSTVFDIRLGIHTCSVAKLLLVWATAFSGLTRLTALTSCATGATVLVVGLGVDASSAAIGLSTAATGCFGYRFCCCGCVCCGLTSGLFCCGAFLGRLWTTRPKSHCREKENKKTEERNSLEYIHELSPESRGAINNLVTG